MRHSPGRDGPKPPPPDRREDEAPQVGVTAPPTDVDTTGSSAERDPQAVTTSPEGWRENRFVQLGGGFFSGLLLGVVPFGGVGHQILDETDTIAHGTPTMRTGLAIGMIVGGLYNVFTGASGEVAGGAATVTGIGAPVGVPAMVVSTTLVVGGAANVAAGVLKRFGSRRTSASASGWHHLNAVSERLR